MKVMRKPKFSACRPWARRSSGKQILHSCETILIETQGRLASISFLSLWKTKAIIYISGIALWFPHKASRIN